MSNNAQGIADEISDAIFEAVDSMVDEYKEIIVKSIIQKVYSYPASKRAMKSRRKGKGGSILNKENISVTCDWRNWILDVSINAPFQGTYPEYEPDIGVCEEYGEDSSPLLWVIENGYKNYKQPYPRPFFEEAVEEITELILSITDEFLIYLYKTIQNAFK